MKKPKKPVYLDIINYDDDVVLTEANPLNDNSEDLDNSYIDYGKID